MDFTPAPRQVVGALRFLAELQAVAAEFGATGVWDDELTARRRQREDVRVIGESQTLVERQVKAL